MKQEIIELRKLMEREGMDAYYIPSGDYHGSEYVNDYFKVCKYMSGFSGEAADLLVTADGAWLWTDSRFFIQAGQQLAGSGIELMKMAEPGVPKLQEFLADLAKKHAENGNNAFMLGFDGRVVTSSFGRELREELEKKGLSAEFRCDRDLAGEIWSSRPAVVPGAIWDFPLSSAGKDTAEKLADIRAEMKKEGADCLLLTDLMESAWLFNLRGSDILYTPVFFAFTLISQEDVRLYLMDGALEEGLPDRLSYVDVRDYGDIYADVASLDASDCIWLDPDSCNYKLFSSIPEGMRVHEAYTPATLMKVIKNETEIRCAKHAHIKDGAAVTKHIKWLKEAVGREPLTEIGVADRLEAYRREQEDFLDLSFPTISAYGPNAAIVHYDPSEGDNAEVLPEGFILIDSGAHYMDGTTDITRTIALGELTQEMIDDYTYVLKSHIRMSMIKVTPEMTGMDVDKLAREPMRENGLDFKHGISHGVGHVLAVHEGPYVIRKSPKALKFKAGMIASNEPGLYLEGRFGIRTENVILFRDDGNGNIVNEPLTCVPYERRAINKALLTEEEVAWIDDYHAWVRESLIPLLDDETAAFVTEETRPL